MDCPSPSKYNCRAYGVEKLVARVIVVGVIQGFAMVADGFLRQLKEVAHLICG